MTCTLEFSAYRDQERLGSLELESQGFLSCLVWIGCWGLNSGHKPTSLQSRHVIGILYLMVFWHNVSLYLRGRKQDER